MTCRELLKLQHPDCVHPQYEGGCSECPHTYGYLEKPSYCKLNDPDEDDMDSICRKCWDREIAMPYFECDICRFEGDQSVCSLCKNASSFEPFEVGQPKILDSGNRREFETGAVRDIQEGKGRCDLMPLDVVAVYLDDDSIIADISNFQERGSVGFLYQALKTFSSKSPEALSDIARRAFVTLQMSKHFEEGAKKYGENNWQKGIPVHCYIDSAVRHYLKFLRGDKDEPHDRAFCWNITCAIWTCNHKPELNEYGKTQK